MLNFAFGLVRDWNAGDAFRDCLVVILNCLAFACVLKEIIHFASSVSRDWTLVWDRLMCV